jgi:hypothetical protein
MAICILPLWGNAMTQDLTGAGKIDPSLSEEDASPHNRRDANASGKLTGIALALAGVAALSTSGDAHAQTNGVPDGFEAVSDLQNIAAVNVQADGSVELVMSNGQTVLIAASDAVVENGILYISSSALEAGLLAQPLQAVEEL